MGGSVPTWLQAMDLVGIHQLLFYRGDKLWWVSRGTDNTHLIPAPPKLSGTSVWSQMTPIYHEQ